MSYKWTSYTEFEIEDLRKDFDKFKERVVDLEKQIDSIQKQLTELVSEVALLNWRA